MNEQDIKFDPFSCLDILRIDPIVYCVYTCTSVCLKKYAPYVAFRKSSYFPNGMLFLVFMKAISDIINIVTNCLLFKSLLLSFIEFKSSDLV